MICLLLLLHLVSFNYADEVSLSEGLPHIVYTETNNQVQDDSAKIESNVASNKAKSFQPAVSMLTRNEESSSIPCPSGVICAKLGGECIDCEFNKSCVYGAEVNVTCRAKNGLHCIGEKSFTRSMICRYCYQTKKWEHVCRGTPQSCRVARAPRESFIANCTVKSEIICLGKRQFPKNMVCNWTSGHRWTTTLILSITLGGFGADRFYLGHWQEGIGKLFSFGGLGVWTIVDVILVATGYIKPADGSLYIW